MEFIRSLGRLNVGAFAGSEPLTVVTARERELTAYAGHAEKEQKAAINQSPSPKQWRHGLRETKGHKRSKKDAISWEKKKGSCMRGIWRGVGRQKIKGEIWKRAVLRIRRKKQGVFKSLKLTERSDI